jgi:hypothetical protein
MKQKNRKNKQVITEMISNVEPCMIPRVQRSKSGGWQGTYSEEQLNEIALKITEESDDAESNQDTSILAVKREVRGRSRGMIDQSMYLDMARASSSSSKKLATSWSHPPRDITVTKPRRHHHSDRTFNKSGTASLRHPYSSSASVDPPDYEEELLIRQARRNNLTSNSSDSSLDPIVICCDTSVLSSKDKISTLTLTIGHEGDQKLSSSTRSVELAIRRNEKKNVATQHQFMDTTPSFTASLEATNEHDDEYLDCNADSLPCETWSLSASASSSTHSDEKMHNQLRSDMMMFQPRPRSPHPVNALRGIGLQQSQSAPIVRGSPTISSMQEKSMTAATWHPIPNNRTKSDHLHDYLYSENVLTTNELHRYIDYLHSSKVEAESKLARLQTDFDLLSMEYERLKHCFVLTGSGN